MEARAWTMLLCMVTVASLWLVVSPMKYPRRSVASVVLSGAAVVPSVGLCLVERAGIHGGIEPALTVAVVVFAPVALALHCASLVSLPPWGQPPVANLLRLGFLLFWLESWRVATG